jgi:signal transduction histidine kinase
MDGRAGEVRLFDRHSFERIAVNLLDNARKYAPGSAVEISTALRGDSLNLEVRDYGPGVPPNQQRRIFQPLVRGQNTGASGFGLGLATVRQLALQNGGDAWVEDACPGARFCVEMKVARSAAEPG